MKKLIYTLVAALAIVSCAGNGSSSKSSASSDSVAATRAAQSEKIYTIDGLLEDAEKLTDKEVTVKGTITHTCKHSGRRCFIVGADQKTSFRVEAKGNIGGFNRELTGSQIAVTGLLRENRLTAEYLNAWEDKVKEKAGKEDGSAESCDAETRNITAMRDWMKKNKKDYYSVFFLDGTSFEVLD
ncbi:MAG: hypothetical protein SNH79_01000 [Rikenellaceae bacterium]